MLIVNRQMSDMMLECKHSKSRLYLNAQNLLEISIGIQIKRRVPVYLCIGIHWTYTLVWIYLCHLLLQTFSNTVEEKAKWIFNKLKGEFLHILSFYIRIIACLLLNWWTMLLNIWLHSLQSPGQSPPQHPASPKSPYELALIRQCFVW